MDVGNNGIKKKTNRRGEIKVPRYTKEIEQK